MKFPRQGMGTHGTAIFPLLPIALLKSYLDWNAAAPARGYRYQDFLEPWERYLSAACSPVAHPSRPEPADLTHQSVSNPQSVMKITNVYADPNTLNTLVLAKLVNLAKTAVRQR